MLAGTRDSDRMFALCGSPAVEDNEHAMSDADEEPNKRRVFYNIFNTGHVLILLGYVATCALIFFDTRERVSVEAERRISLEKGFAEFKSDINTKIQDVRNDISARNSDLKTEIAKISNDIIRQSGETNRQVTAQTEAMTRRNEIIDSQFRDLSKSMELIIRQIGVPPGRVQNR